MISLRLEKYFMMYKAYYNNILNVFYSPSWHSPFSLKFKFSVFASRFHLWLYYIILLFVVIILDLFTRELRSIRSVYTL